MVAGSGLLQLQQVAAHDYQLQPVMTECQDSMAEQKLYVDVGGAVAEPGLYQLEAGARVGEALEVAGGVLPGADSSFVASQLNTAAELNDGDKIFVPVEGQAQEDLSQNQSGSEAESSNLISINKASASELATLPQIGEKRAADIIAGRPYSSVNQLVEQEVITENIYSKIAEDISL